MAAHGLLLVSGCGSSNGPTAAPTVAEVIVTVPATPPETGDTVQLSAVAHDAAGGVIGGLTVAWTSSDSLVAAVAQDGKLLALLPGQAIVEATISGVSGTGTVAVVVPAVASLTLAPGAGALVPGQMLGYQAIPKDKRGNTLLGKVVAWSSSSNGVATVSTAGVVTGIAPGSANLTATVDTRSAIAALTVNEGGVATPGGGSITAFGGEFVLDVPAGAVSAAIPFRVSRLLSAPLDPDYVGGSGYQVSPSLGLAAPATLHLRYNPANGPLGLDEDQLGVHEFGGTQWTVSAGATVDTAGNLAQATLTAVSVVGVHRAPAAAPCTVPESRQFDFWLGSWNYAASGAFPGTDVVTADVQGCVLQEDFLDSSGFHGRSVSFYNPGTGAWYQTFVDSQGGRVLLTGSLVGNQMILYSTSTQRLLWTPVSAVEVTFSVDQSPDGGVNWSEIFTSTYSR